ncbi:MAG TPA: hypothetical protein DIW23_12760 [Anaerolineae bacterium]|nr:hypothetical protein [Anaerolineae bacterium]
MAGQVDKTVFISYRHDNKFIALAICQDLLANGYQVFIDYESINSGDFEQSIIDNIKAHAHFIVVLTPSALDRCDDTGDWLRREIETAMEYKRNIVPILIEGFKFGDPHIEKHLTGNLKFLKRYQGLEVPMNLTYFKYAMKDLRERYLNIELDSVIHPFSSKGQKLFNKQKAFVKKVRQVKQKELTAQKFFEQGFVFYESKKYNEAINSYTKAIKLIPGYAGAYNNRGNIFSLINKADNAMADYTKAVEIDSNYAAAYSNRALIWIDRGDLGNAISDLHKAIKLDPNYSNAYINLGMAYYRKKSFDIALKNYNAAISINPKSGSAYNKRGVTREKKNDIEGALEDFKLAIKYKYMEEEYLPYHNRGRIYQLKGDIKKAIRDYNKSIKLNPNYSVNYFNRAIIFEQKKDYRSAISDYQKYLELGGGIENNNQREADGKLMLLKNKLAQKNKSKKKQ